MADGTRSPAKEGPSMGLANFILFTRKRVAVEAGRSAEAAVDLHQCTDAGNASKNVPLCATIRGAVRG